MNRFKMLATALSAAGLLAVAAPSYAIPALTFTTGSGTYTIDPFSGFDWASNATAVASAPVFDGTTVMTTSYLASASNITLVGGGNGTPAPGPEFEFTIKATIFEVATCLVPSGPNCIVGGFTAVGGTFDIFYDSTPDSNIVTGTGFLDGTRVLGGNINFGFAGTFTVTGVNAGTGSFNFTGGVNFTETDNTKDAYFFPALGSTVATSTLQFGNSTGTGWTAPTSWVDGGGIPAGALIFRADGNQDFTAAPEPGSLALVGLSLAGLALARRRFGKK